MLLPRLLLWLGLWRACLAEPLLDYILDANNMFLMPRLSAESVAGLSTAAKCHTYTPFASVEEQLARARTESFLFDDEETGTANDLRQLCGAGYQRRLAVRRMLSSLLLLVRLPPGSGVDAQHLQQKLLGGLLKPRFQIRYSRR